jgi:hypothetical protein
VCCAVKNKSSIGDWISYVKCGPRISKFLRMKKMTLKWQGTGKDPGSHLELDETTVRISPSQAQIDQSEGWLLEKPMTYISNNNFGQEDIFYYWNGQLLGHTHVKWTYPHVVRMWRQFHGCPGSGAGIVWVSITGGKQHDALKKSTMDNTLEGTLKK